MNQTQQMENRLNSALSTISEAFAKQSALASELAANTGDVTGLQEQVTNLEAALEKLRADSWAELEAARNEAKGAQKQAAKLQNRLEIIRAREQAAADEFEKQRRIQDENHARDAEVWQRIKGFNQELKTTVTELRAQNEKMVGDADLINRSLQQDLEQLKAQRQIDLEEIDSILAQLTPLVEG
jgi:chromosome segregation ATPase